MQVEVVGVVIHEVLDPAVLVEQVAALLVVLILMVQTTQAAEVEVVVIQPLLIMDLMVVLA
jgi:hypothetical protein